MTFSMTQMAQQAKKAANQIAVLSSTQKNQALQTMADNLRSSHEAIITANQQDLASAVEKDLSSAMIDRLTLNPQRIDAIAAAIEEIIALPDPIGEINKMIIRPNGIQVGKMKIPLGVIAMIYEARPNVTADAAALCLKAGNAVILRGGREALNSSLAIAKCLHQALEVQGIDPAAISVVPDPDRSHMNELMTLTNSIDLIIPRGGEGLIKFVSENSRVPVIQHFKGVCHLYVDKMADLDKALNILVNGKIQRPGVCNSLETLLVHEAVASEFLPDVARVFAEKGVKVHGCKKTLEHFDNAELATDADYDAEYLSLEIAIRVVVDFDEAIEHIQQFSSGHTEVIVTKDISTSQNFIKQINSAVVMVNASSRFSDGGELGLGAEIGISTSKLHAYGPMGVESLTTEKFIVLGDGQIRD
ncbi:MAG: glutamate-5-semialdehyde dehydrogenase [Psychrosphaera sp.]|nr:glutamate-5-semialdehyde dehydrogenase [Psychrosphaera sp.]